MPTLHIDTIASRAVAHRMASTADELHKAVSELSHEVSENLMEQWVGNSASQFSDEFTAWSQEMRRLITNLEMMRSRLEHEIVEYSQAASALE